jgi:hypothetical protein
MPSSVHPGYCKEWSCVDGKLIHSWWGDGKKEKFSLERLLGTEWQTPRSVPMVAHTLLACLFFETIRITCGLF